MQLIKSERGTSWLFGCSIYVLRDPLESSQQHDYERAHAFQCEYLDTEPFLEFVQRVAANPDLYFVAVNGDELVGVCYGNPSKRDESVIGLQGIAVNLDETKGYARVGIGSKMIRSL